MVTDYVEIPQCILDLNKGVTLEVYVIFLIGIGFFVSTSGRINFTTLEYLPSRTKGKLGNSLKIFICLFYTSGFKIRTALMDRELNFSIPDFS